MFHIFLLDVKNQAFCKLLLVFPIQALAKSIKLTEEKLYNKKYTTMNSGSV